MEVVDSEELSRFRHQWRCELGLTTDEVRETQGGDGERADGRTGVVVGSRESHGDGDVGQAADLYWMGVAAERSGDVQNAVMYYRQAEQMVPDIEARVGGRPTDPGEDVPSGVVCRLTTAFQNMTFSGPLCQPDGTCTGTHISHLPCEVISYILRWVISSELDIRSLEQCSMVCRGFHWLARDPGLWRSICFRIWGKVGLSTFAGSWRDLFLQKAHLLFNGIYISKSSYVRQGEKSLDGYYKPYHTVTYYRYLRFFADGSVMYQTSPEDPPSVVARFSHKHISDSIHLGQYTAHGDQVSVEIASLYSSPPAVGHRSRHRWSQPAVTNDYTFHLELQVSGRNFGKLAWLEHSCRSVHRPSGRTQITHFTVDYKYTPFVFSRVKSFMRSSHKILSIE